MENKKSFIKILIIGCILISVSFGVGVYSDKNKDYVDPLAEAGCVDGGSIYYWDFTNDTDDFRHSPLERLSGYEKGNFYIFCNDIKDHGEAVLFKDNKSIFKTGLVYKGYMFMDYDNYFNVIEGIYGEANYCPNGYILKRYRYNLETDLMDLVETKEYLTEEIVTPEGYHACVSKELDEFIDNNFIN